MTLDTAVVGAGVISKTHLNGLVENPRTNPVAVCDLDESRARDLADEYTITPYFDVDTLFEDEDLDWVHICTPVQTHFEIAKTAIEAGVPVLIEKPVTDSLEELEELERLSNHHNVPVSPVHQHLFDPVMRDVRERIQSGEIGDIRGVDLIYTGQSAPDATNRGSWVFDLPGGEFEEAFPHPIYLGLGVSGYPADESSVSATTSLYGDYDGDFAYDTVQLQYTTEDDVVCNIKMVSGSKLKREIHIHGTEQSITVDLVLQMYQTIDEDFDRSSLAKAKQAVSYSADRITGLISNVRLVAESQWHDDWEHAQRANSHYALFDQTARAIEQDRPMPVELESAKWTITFMEKIRETAVDEPNSVMSV